MLQSTDARLHLSPPRCQSCTLPLVTALLCSHNNTMPIKTTEHDKTDQPLKGVPLV